MNGSVDLPEIPVGKAIKVTANGVKLPVFASDLEEHLKGVEMIELMPDNVNIVDGDLGGETSRALVVDLEGFPRLMLIMPLLGAQKIGEAMATGKIDVRRTMPGHLLGGPEG